MSGWTGGLSPAGRERVDRQRASGVAGSMLSAPAAAALRAAGLEPAGEVMGCVVMHLGWNGVGCTYNKPYASASTFRGGMGPYIRARHRAYETALRRLTAEVQALDADGAVGVTLTWTDVDGGARELMAVGTAVRWRADRLQHDYRTFATELDGESVAAAVSAGWVPLGVVVGICAGLRHVDPATRLQLRSGWLGNGNAEVDGVSRLVRNVREGARAELRSRGARFLSASGWSGREVQLVISDSWLDLSRRDCDHVADAGMLGTALGRDPAVPRRTARRPLAVLPLTPSVRTGAAPEPADRPPER